MAVTRGQDLLSNPTRGHVMLAWASAGMAAAVYYEVKRRKASQELAP